ncbi:SRPBCC domain-containing protein [Nocardia terpenica]|uniref:SRPBCC domain-containing protein n=1 Tax=Nocardia terpenica TaxID=455432 RepID=A0A6G9Z350_9NOCA|nr:SRPBCC domain-containing protein [Nocardia terpenica]QIS20035.1 SRPBCC domain-containing protein [Nocardia terpenica]
MAFVIDETVEIAAPAEVVWRVLTDLERYGEWNPFCISCRSTLEPGAPIDMRVRLGGRERAQREWVRTHTPGTEFSYAMKPIPLGALHSLRSHTLTPLEGGRVRYHSHFELDGWLRPVVTAMLGSALRQGFTAMTAAVRQRAEQSA